MEAIASHSEYRSIYALDRILKETSPEEWPGQICWVNEWIKKQGPQGVETS
jgi:hypothetical protein